VRGFTENLDETTVHLVHPPRLPIVARRSLRTAENPRMFVHARTRGAGA